VIIAIVWPGQALKLSVHRTFITSPKTDSCVQKSDSCDIIEVNA